MKAHASLPGPSGEPEEGLLSILRQSTPACLVWLDAEGEVRFTTDACEEIFDHRPAGEFLAALCNPDAPPCLLQDPQPPASDQTHEAIFPCRGAEGRTRWLAHACRPTYDATGRFLGRTGIFVDITPHREKSIQARRVSERFQRLSKILEALNRAETPDEVHTVAAEGILGLLEADGAAVLLFDDDGVPRFAASRGISETYRRKVEGHSPWPPDARDAQPLWYENAREHADFPEALRAAFRAEGIVSLAFIPLPGNDRLLGKLMVYYRRPHTFGESEQRLARVFAGNLAAALRQAQAYQALKNSEARFRALAESTPAAVYMIENNHFTYTNPAFRRLTGYTTEDLSRLRYWEILHEDSRGAAIGRARRRMAGQHVDEYVELRVRRKNGEYRWALAGDSIVELGGRVIAVGSAVDITLLKQAEAALRESEARFRDLIEHLRDGIGLHDLEGRILASNPTVPRLLGHDTLPEEPVYIPDLLAPEVRHQFADYIRQLQHKGVAEGLMLVQMPTTGEKRLWEYHSTLRAAKGIEPVVRFYIRDVTEREKASRALRESEARFRALAESTPAGIYVLAENNAFAYTNPAFSRLTGYTPDELLTLSPWDLLHPDFRDRVRANAEARLRGEAVPSPYEVQLITKNGEVRWVLLGAARITWQGQAALMGSVVDLTAHKHYQHALEAEIRLMQAFGKITAEGLHPLAERIVETAHDLLPAATRAFLLLTDEENRLCIEAALPETAARRGRCFSCPSAVQTLHTRTAPFLLTEAPPNFTKTCSAPLTLTPHAAVVPLSAEETTLGVLILDKAPQSPPFSAEDLRVLGHFANTATLLLQYARLLTDLQRRLQEMETVHRLTLALRNTLETSTALEILLDETLAAVGSDAGTVLLYQPEHNRLEPAAGRGWMQTLDLRPEPAEGIIGEVFTHNRPAFSDDLSRSPLPDFRHAAPLPAGWGGACLPLHTSEQPLGVLLIGLPPGRRWTESQRYLLETLAELGSITLHRIGLLSETRQRLQQLQSLQVLAQAITGSLDLHLTLGILLEQAQAQFQADAADVLLVDEAMFTLSAVAAAGFLSPTAARRTLSLAASLPGQVALQGAPLVLSDLQATLPLHENCRLFLQSERVRTYIGIPLIAKGQTRGVLELFYRSPTRLTTEQVDFLSHVGRYAAIALENAQMVESLQKSANELRAAYEATIEGWARALELRDEETEGHAQRVSTLTVALARRMGVADERLPHIRRGALLHDIGKMGIPDRILKKPGPLDDHEWEIMRQHPLWAYDMLKDIPYLQPALTIPLFHHERWDGSGYPSGLAGEAIPLEARIFAVVDVYDALTSHRPYRPAWSKEKTLAYLEAQKGRLFDPRVVDAFLDMLRAAQPTPPADVPAPSP